MSLILWRYYEIHCLLPLGPEAQLPGLDYQPEAGPQQPQLLPSPAQVASCMAKLSQGEGLYALLSCSYLQHAPVHTTAACDLMLKAACIVCVPGEGERETDSAGGQLTPTSAQSPGQVRRIACAYFSLLTTEGAWLTSSGRHLPSRQLER